MEMLIIEKQAFDELTGRIERLQTLLNGLYTESGAAPQKWLDNPRACLRLSASRRTLQSLRDSCILPFTKMGQKYSISPKM